MKRRRPIGNGGAFFVSGEAVISYFYWLFGSFCSGSGHLWQWVSDNAGAVQAVCLVASAAAAVALIRHSSVISRREKTIEMIRETMLTDDGRAPYERFRSTMRVFKGAGRSVAELAELIPEDHDSYDIVNRQLNFYELVSLGIRQHVFDEKFFKMWFRSQVMRDHARLLPYMEALSKSQGPAFFSEFRWLIGRWEREEHPAENVPVYTLILWLLKGKRQRVANALIRQVQKRAARRATAEQMRRASDIDE